MKSVEVLLARETLRNVLRQRITLVKAALDDCARGHALTPEGALYISDMLTDCEMRLLDEIEVPTGRYEAQA